MGIMQFSASVKHLPLYRICFFMSTDFFTRLLNFLNDQNIPDTMNPKGPDCIRNFKFMQPGPYADTSDIFRITCICLYGCRIKIVSVPIGYHDHRKIFHLQLADGLRSQVIIRDHLRLQDAF